MVFLISGKLCTTKKKSSGDYENSLAKLTLREMN